jgi:CBS domain containing-hemolysin-like protein
VIAWLAILGCWGVSFVFAGIEAGILSLDPVRLRHHVKTRKPAALRLNDLLKRPERLLVTVLLVTNFAEISALLILTRQLVISSTNLGFFVAFAIALPVDLFVLGVLPKTLFRRFPFRALGALAGVLETTTTVLSPLLVVGSALASVILPRRIREERRIFVAREELKQITTQSEREGSLTAIERAMIHNVVDFRMVKVTDVMIPLTKVVAVTPEALTADLLNQSVQTGVDRLPVISSEGRVVGLVNVLDVLLDKTQPRALSAYVRRIVSASENESAYRLIRRLRAARLSLAAVVNREHKAIGIVTTEDMIKRLVQSA